MQRLVAILVVMLMLTPLLRAQPKRGGCERQCDPREFRYLMDCHSRSESERGTASGQ